MADRIFGDQAAADWRPAVRKSRLEAFLSGCGAPSVEALHRRAIEQPAWFWDRVVQELGVSFSKRYDQVVDESEGKAFPRWFVGGQINLAQNLLVGVHSSPDPDVALIAEGEDGSISQLTRGELKRQVGSLAAFLRSRGIGKGDRVALFVPMICEAAVSYLACAAIGAITVPIFSGYGPDGVSGRVNQAGCRVLVTADGFARRGKFVGLTDIARKALAHCTTVETVLIVGGHAAQIEGVETAGWADALTHDADLTFEPMDPNDPLLIMFTSGTTGEPKGVVLTHGGFLTKVAQEFGLIFDFNRDDVILWLGDMGWMVGPLLVTGTLFFGATAVLYGGSIDVPDAGRLWAMAERHGVTVLGVSPTAVRMLRMADDDLPMGFDLSRLRAFISTGEAWNEGPWWWLFDTVGHRRLPILNYTGGTETGGGILACYADRPLRSGGFYGPVLGMDADVVDQEGKPVRGVPGELVVRNTWPGMTRGLWNDHAGRYLETYWERYPGVWAHGDLAVIDEHGYWYVLGRSDDTLKIAGKRVGPAEIETAMLAHPAVVSAAAIGIPDEQRGQALVCFAVVSATSQDAEGTLLDEVRSLVVARLGKSLAPTAMHLVGELPVTKTGKLMRRLVRAKYLGLPVGDTSGLESPYGLESIPSRRMSSTSKEQ